MVEPVLQDSLAGLIFFLVPIFHGRKDSAVTNDSHDGRGDGHRLIEHAAIGTHKDVVGQNEAA